MKDYIPHPSIRGYFAHELHLKMHKNKSIWVVVGDLGYKMWDKIKEDYPDRFINTGASEQAMMGIAVGLALEGKIPFVYSISTFLILRAFETIRNYIDYEKIPVRLIGAGNEKDYLHDGISHWLLDQKRVMKQFKNIESRWPKDRDEIPALVNEMLINNKPWYVCLKR